MAVDADGLIGGVRRPFVRKEGAWSFGPTGRRLWATWVDSSPGFSGSFDFIHRTGIPVLFSVGLEVNGRPVALEPGEPVWYPSRSESVHLAEGLEVGETRFITDDDCAVSVLSLTNRSGRALHVLPHIRWPRGSSWSYERFGLKVFVEGGVSGPGGRGLGPGESGRWTVACAFGLGPSEAAAALRRWLGDSAPRETHIRAYSAWFRQCPSFECSEPDMERLWAYRWYLLRRNIACNAAGLLRHPVIYEGRGAKMTLDPWDPRGWEFSQLIPFSTPMHLLEGRWHPDAAEACRGSVAALVENQRDDGIFPCVQVHSTAGWYANFVSWAVWQLHRVRPDLDWLSVVAPGLQRELDGVLRTFAREGEVLPVLRDHGRTGKEYQPGFFHSAGYPRERPDDHAAALKRVDFACYTHMNADALAAIWGALGRPEESDRCREIAWRVRRAILSEMWDAGDRFFFDVDAASGRRVPVRHVVGFDPFVAGIAGPGHLAAFDALADPGGFAAPYPVPSCERRNPAYSPVSGWMGVQIKGPHGCLWNGPTWPFANSMVLMSLAAASRAAGHSLDDLYARLFRSSTALALREGIPVLYEHYNPETGDPISQEEHYFHSTWLDPLISHVMGLSPGEKPDPVRIGLEWARLSGVDCPGHEGEAVLEGS